MKKLLLTILIITLMVWVNVWAVVIDIGSDCVNRSSINAGNITYIDLNNPANATGKITSVCIWAAVTMASAKMAIFYRPDPGSFPDNFTARSVSGDLGAVIYGSGQNFAVNLDVVEGDFLGIYFTDADDRIEAYTHSGIGVYYKAGDWTTCVDETFSFFNIHVISIHGTGITAPGQVTNVQATDGVHTDKVVVTWDAVDGADKYYVWNGSSWIDVGDVTTWNHTGAPAPTITTGTASASDGASSDYVTLSIAGESANNGSSISYKVKAWNAVGYGPESASNSGYRGVGALTYQWQRSAADSDADYSNIDGATTDPYNDTGAPEDGSGRYYKCVENATGATEQTTNADRGYRISGLTWNGVTILKWNGITVGDINTQ